MLVELTASMTILAVGFLALAASMSGGFRQIALGRQRQSGAEVGNGRIEHLRNVPYPNVSVSSDVTHNTNADHPDHLVRDSDNTFDYSGTGTYEPLIENAVDGQVTHFESPVVVGTTTLTVFQYVTWVDDPAITGTQDYRRVTVVVQYEQRVPGTARVVRTSSFFTPGNVTLGGSGVVSSQGTAPPMPSPSPTSTGAGCPESDSAPPTGDFVIQGGTVSETGYTASASVTLSYPTISDGCTPIRLRFSNDGTNYSADIIFDSGNTAVGWALTGGDGTKNVSGKIRDGRGNEKTVGPLGVVLDTTRPSVPGTLSRTLACSGSLRTVNLSWGSSTDTNLRGYRIYKSIDNAPWMALGTVSTTSGSDTDSKLFDSLRYYVVGYDKAGNESLETNQIALSKNQCV